MNRIEALIHKAITEHDMLKDTKKIVVGYSGGADSTVLLHYLANHFDGELVAAHINHNLRGEESERDMRHAERFCDEHRIRFALLSRDIASLAKETGRSVEECGRDVRYGFFNFLCEDCSKIATAHTLSDSCETMLFNLSRGTGIKGLCGIPFVRGNIIRPIRLLTREDVEEYCDLYNLPYVNDSTNSDIIYSRNRIRHNIIPELKALNSSVLNTMESLSEQLTDAESALDYYADTLYSDAHSENGLIIRKLRGAPKAAVSHLIVRLLKEKDVTAITSKKIDEVISVIKNNHGAVTFGNHIRLSAEQGFLILSSNIENKSFCEPLITDGSLYIPQIDTTIQAKLLKNCKFNKENTKMLFHNLLDYDTIRRYAIFRGRKEGDTFKPLNRGCTKTVKKLMQEKKIPASLRDNVIMLEQDGEIIWSSMSGVAEGFSVSDKTETALYLDIQKGRVQ